MEGLGNIYRNKSQTCCPKDKPYRYAWLRELVHSTVEHTSEHEFICRSKPTGDKHKEGETAAERQPPLASGCEVVTSSWGWWLGVAKTWTWRAKAHCASFLMEGLRLLMLKQDKHSGHEDLCDLDRRSVIPYVHGRIGVALQCIIQALAWLLPKRV
jgi:hypothetical protein